jgi:hypothetical protein
LKDKWHGREEEERRSGKGREGGEWSENNFFSSLKW